MFDVRSIAAGYRLDIELSDLGDWNALTLISEYDPAGPIVRLNARAIERYRAARGALDSADVRRFIDFAIAHEIYHHREAVGEIPRLATRAQREEAANAYARSIVSVDAFLDAFLTGR